MHHEDPHGARGSTEHHALDYKGTVKQYNSADILASFNSASSGQAPASGATTVAATDKPSSLTRRSTLPHAATPVDLLAHAQP